MVDGYRYADLSVGSISTNRGNYPRIIVFFVVLMSTDILGILACAGLAIIAYNSLDRLMVIFRQKVLPKFPW